MFILYAQADNVNTTELIEWQLRSTGQFSDDQMSGLLDIWRSTHARIYAYYHLAAQAYFKYLQLSDFNTVFILYKFPFYYSSNIIKRFICDFRTEPRLSQLPLDYSD